MTYRDTQIARRALNGLATAQGGYFTTKQAATAGYGRQHLDYHAKAGNFERVDHGLYRLPTVPRSREDDLIRLSLWSRGREDEPQAVISHETALAIHELGELLPHATHLTVPRSFRKRPPRGCLLHHATLSASHVEEREGFRVTTPLRTILDVALGTSVSSEQLRRIVKSALERGLVRKPALTFAIKSDPANERLTRAIRPER
jgi:predicted transcriptional regulator of viral defense system